VSSLPRRTILRYEARARTRRPLSGKQGESGLAGGAASVGGHRRAQRRLGAGPRRRHRELRHAQLAILVTLLGAERLAWQVEALGATTSKVLTSVPKAPFREMNSSRGPLLAATATAVAFAVSALIRDGWVAALLRGATWLVLGIAIWTFLWTYASLQLGLHRLGRARLRPQAALVDPVLGLRPLGAVAFAALSVLFASLVPVVVTGLSDVVGLVIGLLVLGSGLAAFFFSPWGFASADGGAKGEGACVCS
jgi:hypothetical protein